MAARARAAGSGGKPASVLRRHWRLMLLSVVALGLLGAVGRHLGVSWAANRHLDTARRELARRRPEAALEHLRRCVELRPDHAEAHFLAARTARRCKKYADADQHLAACKRLGWSADALTLEQLLRRVQEGDLAEAERLERMARDHPDANAILEALARGYTKAVSFGTAVDALDRLLRARPDDVDALFLRGQLYEVVERLDESLADYRRAAELAPDDDDLRWAMARGLLRDGQTTEARQHLQDLLSRRPDHPGAGPALARCLLAEGRMEEARDLLDRVLASQPDNGLALFERGKVELEVGDVTVAESWLRRALARLPANIKVKYNLALCLQRLGREGEAAGLFAEADRAEDDQRRLNAITEQIHQFPDKVDLRAEAGALSLRLGLEKEGIQWYTSALRLNPQHRPSREALAAFRERAGNLPRPEAHRRLPAVRTK